MGLFAHFSIGCERCPFGRDISSCQAGFAWAPASRTGFVPVRLRFGGHCTASLLISSIVKRSLRDDNSGTRPFATMSASAPKHPMPGRQCVRVMELA
jgi:hypothetical protein